MPEDVDKCVRSVLDDNPEYDESTARAICWAQKNKGNLDDFDAADADDARAEMRLAADGSGGESTGSVVRFARTRTLAAKNGGKRVEEGDTGVRYEQIMLLAPGEWTDAGSGETIYYAPDAIERSAENWVDNQLNIYHKPGEPLKNVGYVDTETVDVDGEGRLYADIVLHGRTSASKDAIGLMDLAMETGGDQGLGGPSVEIPQDKVEWDDDMGALRSIEMEFSGVGLVQNPASKPVAFAEQFSGRGVALADGSAEDAEIRIMERNNAPPDKGPYMGTSDDDTTGGNLPTALRNLQNDMAATRRRLQSDADMAARAVDAYREEGGAGDDDLTEFLNWLRDSGNEDMADAVESMATAFTNSTDNDMESATVADFRSWAEGTTEAEDGSDDEESDDEESDEDDDAELEAAELVSTLESMSETMDAAVETLESEVNTLENRASDLDDKMSKLDKRLSEVEDDPNVRSLADAETPDDDDDTDTVDSPESTAVRSRTGYLSR